MKNLFIIGNGFDKAHKLKTSYNHFKEFILKNYPEIKKYVSNEDIPEIISQPDGECKYDELDMIRYIYNRINYTLNEEWNSFEEELGNINFTPSHLGEACGIDEDGDYKMWHMSAINEDATEICVPFSESLKKLFIKWVEQINFSTAQKKFKLIKDDNLYFTFNYTDTLNKIYDINHKNILHIHGDNNSEPIFGHGKSFSDIQKEVDDTIGSLNVGSENNVENSRRILKKNVEERIEMFATYFSDLENNKIEKIYVYGFSFANVDLPYLKKIFEVLGEKVEWLVYYHHKNKDPNHNLQKKLKLKKQLKSLEINNFKLISTNDFPKL